MKALWAVISIMALVNLLAILGAATYLVVSDRLDRDRVWKIRQVLSEPITIEKARLEAEHKEEEARRKAEETAARLQREPATAADLLALRIETSEVDQQRLERLRREVEDLRTTLSRERALLDRDLAAFEARQEAAEKEARSLAETRGSEQFRKSLATYESLRPADAAAALRGLMESPAVASGSVDGVTLAVMYLDAMDERTRARIVSEFIKTDAAMAAGLLERLRNLGVPPGSQGLAHEPG